MQKSYLLDMTWEEFRDCVNPELVVLVPMGSVELEGPHLPLGVDTIVAGGVAARLKGEEGVLIGPCLPLGHSKWFTPFPGTVSLEHATLTSLLLEYCRSLIPHGVRRFVFLNAHRGNNACVDETSRTLILERPLRLGMLGLWKLANDLVAANPGLIQEGKFTHAGELMTSIVLALRPDTVVKQGMHADSPRSPEGSPFRILNSLGEASFQGLVQTVYPHIREITATGVFGDPTTASAEKGEALLDLMTAYIKAFLQAFRKLPLSAQAE
ncbi:MAG: creatininase family protein [Deltaproteobacteria bacterium]|nr:creatininase family protein [Deltaproteobacteria bacterium]